MKTGEIIGTIDSTSQTIDLQKAKNALSQAEANYSIKVQPLSDLQKQQIEGTLASSQIDYQNKQIGFEQNIATSQKTIADLKLKLANYQDDLNALLQTDSTDPGSSNEKDFSIQVMDVYQTISQDLETIDQFMGISPKNSNLNDTYEQLIAAKNSALKTQAEDLWRDLKTVTPPTSIVLTQNMIDTTLADITKMCQLLTVMISVMDATIPDGTNLTSATILTDKNQYSSMYTALTTKYQSVNSALTNASDQKRTINQEITQAQADIDYQNQQIALNQKEIDTAKASNDQQLANDKISYDLQLNPLTDDQKRLAQLELASAQIAIQEAEVALAKTQIKSPVDGVILTLTGHVGETSTGTFATIATQ